MSDSVLICLSHGFHVRNIIYSRLYEHLTRTLHVTVVLPSGVVIPEEDRRLLLGASVTSVTVAPHRFEDQFSFLRKNVFAGRERTQTFNLISELERAKHPLVYRLAGWFNAVLGRLPAVGRLWQKIEAHFIPGTEFDALMEEWRPKVVITANYGTESFEVRLLRAAHRYGAPTLAVIPSWDNLSSKGVIGENPKHLAVWNLIMRDEAISLYGFKEAAIHICGGLQFDVYAAQRPAEDHERVLQRLGIDPRHPFVVIGTITPRYFANNVDIVDIVNEAVMAGRLPADLQIVVRLHPQVVDDPHFGDNLEQYRERARAHSRIKLSIPRVLRWGRITPPTPEDGQELMTLLQYAAVSVMPASTLAIDACALGAPVIGVGFDGREVKPYQQSVRRTFDFTHYRRIVALGGLRIAESKDMLIAEILAYLGDRTRDKEGRTRIVSSHLGALDGASWKRVLNVVRQLMKKASEPNEVGAGSA
jgi:hypothetical protein